MNDRPKFLLAALLPLLLFLTCCVTAAQDKKVPAPAATIAPEGPSLLRIVFGADTKGNFAPCPT